MSNVNESNNKQKDLFVLSATLKSSFRNWINDDPSAEFRAEANRYHLYVARACSWSHRTLVVLKLKGLESVISYSLVDGVLDIEKGCGWAFGEHFPDPHHPNFTHLKNVYQLNDPNYADRVTIPVLFDLKTQKIVNNESSEIMRMLNCEFNTYARYPQVDLYPLSFRNQIDSLNDELFVKLNSGVYRAGFAKTQQIYSQAFSDIFEMLDTLESILNKQRYLINNENMTESDIRAWTTLIRFDPVYVNHFKCNKKMISKDYPNLFGFIREIYQTANISETVDIDEIKKHYFKSHVHINPTRVIAEGPEIDYSQPHERDIRNYE